MAVVYGSFTLAQLNTAVSDANLAASGSNSDITSLAGLTTPLSIAQGGTGNALGAGMTLIASATASASATVDFTAIQNTVYDSYLVVMDSVIPATNAVSLRMRVSNSGVWLAGASDYVTANFRYSSTASGLDGGTTSSLSVSGDSETIGNTVVGAFAGQIRINNCLQTSNDCRWMGQYNYNNSAGTTRISGVNGGGINSAPGARDGFRFFMSSGNIASGTFKLYGLRT